MSRTHRILLTLLAMALATARPGHAQIISLELGQPNNFLPPEAAPIKGSQAALRFTLDAAPGRYRAEGLSSFGSVVSAQEVVKVGPAGTLETFNVPVPLVEGSQTFQIRVTDLTNNGGASVAGPSNLIVREQLTGVSAVSLDRISPDVRTTSQDSARLTYTLSGSSVAYAVSIERTTATTTMIVGTLNVTGTGEMTANVALENGSPNTFRLRARSADFGADPVSRVSNLLTVIRDGDNPQIADLRLTSTTNPTPDTVVSLTGRTEPFSRVVVDNGFGDQVTTESDILGNFTVRGIFLPLFGNPTDNIFSATVTDPAGNVGPTASITITRVDDEPQFSQISLIPSSGSFITEGVPVVISGSVIGLNTPLDVTILTRIGSSGAFEVQDTLTGLNSGEIFRPEFVPTPQVLPPFADVIYSVQAQARSTSGQTDPQLVGTVTIDLTDPATPVLPNRFASRLYTNANFVTLQGQAERFAQVEFENTEGIEFLNDRSVPVESSPALEGGEFVQIIDMSSTPADVDYSIPYRTVARSGRVGTTSQGVFLLTRDTDPPEVLRLDVNDVDANINRNLFFREGQLVFLRVVMDEPMTLAPDVFVTEKGQDGFPAQFNSQDGAGRIFTYIYATTFNTDGTADGIHDGPVDVEISGGADRAGNPIVSSVLFSGAFDKDSLPPDLDRVQVRPTLGDPVNRAPRPLIITIVEDPRSVQPASGVDIGATQVQVFGPLETDPTRELTGATIPFSPQTVEFRFDPGQFVKEGTYQIRVRVRDNAGNEDSPSITLVLDATALNEKFFLGTNPPSGACVNATSMPMDVFGNTFVGASFDPSVVSEINFDATTMALMMFCPHRRARAGSTVTSGTDSIRFVLDRPLRSDGEDDGLYSAEVFLTDIAGNVTPFVTSNFVVDTVAPFVAEGIPTPAGTFGPITDDSFFPKDLQVIGGPLRAVSADVIDGVAANNFTGCGIKTDPTTGTSMFLTLVETHPTTTLQPGSSTQNLPDLMSTLRFESISDPINSPCFVGLRRTRILLELRTDPVTGAPLGLRNDGTHDGRWFIVIDPVDGAENRGERAISEFVYDTIRPVVTVDSVQSNEFITSNVLMLTGTAHDNPKSANDAGQGIQEILVTLERAEATGATTQPALIAAQPATLPSNLRFLRAGETFKWRLESYIPPYQGMGRLVIRARDVAGNVTDIIRTVRVDSTKLPPPRLREPTDDSFLPNPRVAFAWDQIDGASRYRVTLTDPAGDSVVVETPSQENFANISLLGHLEGPYTWVVQALDSQRTAGRIPAMFRFTLDLTPPRIKDLFAFDPVPPDIDGGTFLGNQVRLGIEFSEPMDTTRSPTVTMITANPLLPELKFVELLYLEDQYRAVVNLSPGLDAPDPNGMARVLIDSAVDRAGNPLVDPERSFEIKLGPYFEVSAFANPIHRRELKFHFKSLSAQGGTPDRLLGVPFSRITQSGGRAQVLDVKKVNDFVYAGIYTVDPTRPGTATVEVHGSDLEGNGITRRLTFNIQDVEPLSLSSIRGVSNAFYLNLPTRTVANRETFYVLSGDFVSGAGESPFGTVRDHELEPVINLGTILGQAAGAGIQARVDMEQVPVTVRRKPGLGLYKVLGDQITFLGGPNSSGSIEAPVAQAAGSYWLAADGKAPTIQVPDAPAEGPFPVDSARPRVSFSIEDAGSGLDSGTVIANLDGRRVMTIGTGSQGVVALDRDLSAGSHELVLSAADRSGNRSTRTLAMLVPNILEVRSFVPWPNPARMISNLRYELTQSAAQAQISIYDASGRRVLRLEAPTFAGEHDVVWDLTDRDGRPVGPGIYPVRLIVTFPDGERVVKRTKIAVSG